MFAAIMGPPIRPRAANRSASKRTQRAGVRLVLPNLTETRGLRRSDRDAARSPPTALRSRALTGLAWDGSPM